MNVTDSTHGERALPAQAPSLWEVVQSEHAAWYQERYAPANSACQRAFDLLPSLGTDTMRVTRGGDGVFFVGWHNFAVNGDSVHALSVEAVLDPKLIKPWNLARLHLLTGQIDPRATPADLKEMQRRFGVRFLPDDRVKDVLLEQIIDEVPRMVGALSYEVTAFNLTRTAAGVVVRPVDPDARSIVATANGIDRADGQTWRPAVYQVLNAIDTTTCVQGAHHFQRYISVVCDLKADHTDST